MPRTSHNLAMESGVGRNRERERAGIKGVSKNNYNTILQKFKYEHLEVLEAGNYAHTQKGEI